LAEIASSDSPSEKPRRPGPISPPGAKPPIANFDGRNRRVERCDAGCGRGCRWCGSDGRRRRGSWCHGLGLLELLLERLNPRFVAFLQLPDLLANLREVCIARCQYRI